MKDIEKQFDDAFPNKLAEVVDDFGSTIKQDIKSFLRTSLLRQLDEIERESLRCDEYTEI